jgi:hypothetical protein
MRTKDPAAIEMRMRFPVPDVLLAPLAARLPPHPAWLPQALAGAGLAGAAVAIGFHHHWIGAGLLAAGLAAAGVGGAGPVLSLGLLLLPFGFGLADGSRALAAMFLMLALTVLTVLRGGHVSAVTWFIAAGLLLAALLPDRFSLLAYLIGIMGFVAAGQGVAERRT